MIFLSEMEEKTESAMLAAAPLFPHFLLVPTRFICISISEILFLGGFLSLNPFVHEGMRATDADLSG